jgi:hypothetical protein
MELTTKSFVEHQTSGSQELLPASTAELLMLAPGGTTTCLGCTCCSCCCSGAGSVE